MIDRSADLSFIGDLHLQIINFNNFPKVSLENSSAGRLFLGELTYQFGGLRGCDLFHFVEGGGGKKVPACDPLPFFS